MELKTIRINIPQGCNILLGQTHFIKTIEDLFEIFVSAVPGIRFGIAFNEASGPCLVRREGNDSDLVQAAVENVKAVGAGHTFLAILREAYPINVLNAVKMCQEVCSIYCATANPVEVIVAAKTVDVGGESVGSGERGALIRMNGEGLPATCHLAFAMAHGDNSRVSRFIDLQAVVAGAKKAEGQIRRVYFVDITLAHFAHPEIDGAFS